MNSTTLTGHGARGGSATRTMTTIEITGGTTTTEMRFAALGCPPRHGKRIPLRAPSHSPIARSETPPMPFGMSHFQKDIYLGSLKWTHRVAAALLAGPIPVLLAASKSAAL